MSKTFSVSLEADVVDLCSSSDENSEEFEEVGNAGQKLKRKRNERNIRESGSTKRTCSSSKANGQIVEPLSRAPFFLMRTQGVPQEFNALATFNPEMYEDGTIGITDLAKGDFQECLLSNYMFDIDWLTTVIPRILNVGVTVIHGDTQDASVRQCFPNITFYKPPLPSYGTHHSKMMILYYKTGVRIVIHTANYIPRDWTHKTQGFWFQDFPFLREGSTISSNIGEDFCLSLRTYLSAVGGPCRRHAESLTKYDFSSVSVALVPSIPAWFRPLTGSDRNKYGHMRLRSLLQRHARLDPFAFTVAQFSSLGSLSETWLDQFLTSLHGGAAPSAQIKKNFSIIWPTVEDVRSSLEGWAAGQSIPCNTSNQKVFLKPFLSKWSAEVSGRGRAMPHIKTYVSVSREEASNIVNWCLLTSSNLSKSAWGELNKKGEYRLRSFELGVLFTPSLLSNRWAYPYFSCVNEEAASQLEVSALDVKAMHEKAYFTLAKSVGHLAPIVKDTTIQIPLPVPYDIPPLRYRPTDEPWVWDQKRSSFDSHGRTLE